MTYSVPAPDITASLPPQNLPPTLPQLNPIALSYMTAPYPVYSVLPPTDTFGTTISNQASFTAPIPSHTSIHPFATPATKHGLFRSLNTAQSQALTTLFLSMARPM